MNLETLLEAAEYLEFKSIREPKTRVPTRRDDVAGFLRSADDFHRYAKSDPQVVSTVNPKTVRDNDFANIDEDFLSRERRRAGGAGTREVHNKLEKNRRAHLKECFDVLKGQLPGLDDKKVSNLTILRHALSHIQLLKTRDLQFEKELQRLSRERKNAQLRVNKLKVDLARMNIEVNLSDWMSSHDQDSNSTSTATEVGEDREITSDEQEDDNMNSDTDTDIEVELPYPVSTGQTPMSSVTPLTSQVGADTRLPPFSMTITPPSPPPQFKQPSSKPMTVLTAGTHRPVAQFKQQTDTQRALQQHILKQQQRAHLPVVKIVATSTATPFTQSTVKVGTQMVKKITHVQPTATPGGTVVTTASRIMLVNKTLHKAINSPIQTVNRSPSSLPAHNIVFSGSTPNQLYGHPQLATVTAPQRFGGIISPHMTTPTQMATLNLGHIQGLRVVTPGAQNNVQQIVTPVSQVATLQMMAKVPQTNTPLLAGLGFQHHVVSQSTPTNTYLSPQTLSFLPTSQHMKTGTVPISVGPSFKQPMTTIDSAANTSAAVAALLSAAGAIRPPVTTHQIHSMMSPMAVTPITMTTVNSSGPTHILNPQIIGGNLQVQHVMSPTATLMSQPKQQIVLHSNHSTVSVKPPGVDQPVGVAKQVDVMEGVSAVK